MAKTKPTTHRPQPLILFPKRVPPNKNPALPPPHHPFFFSSSSFFSKSGLVPGFVNVASHVNSSDPHDSLGIVSTLSRSLSDLSELLRSLPPPPHRNTTTTPE